MFNQTQSSDLETENNYTFTIHLLSGEVAEEKKQINHQKSKQKRQKNPLFSSLVISAAVQKVVWIVTKRVKNAPKDYLNIFCFDRK